MRKYGIYYDLNEVVEVQLDFAADTNNKDELNAIYDEQEPLYQTLWQQYFKSVNIAARKKHQTTYTAHAPAVLEVSGGEATMK